MLGRSEKVMNFTLEFFLKLCKKGGCHGVKFSEVSSSRSTSKICYEIAWTSTVEALSFTLGTDLTL